MLKLASDENLNQHCARTASQKEFIIQSNAIKKMELLNSITKLPDQKVNEVEKFVKGILAQLDAEHPKPISLKGIGKIRDLKISRTLEQSSNESGLNSAMPFCKRDYNSTVDLTPEFIKIGETTIFGELHDRLILSTAKWLDVPMISSDRDFEDIEGIEVIWK